MHWENLRTVDPLGLALLLALLVAFAWLVRRAAQASRAERQRRIAAERAYFQGGGLIRALMARWHKGPPRLTDQRSGDEPH